MAEKNKKSGKSGDNGATAVAEPEVQVQAEGQTEVQAETPETPAEAKVRKERSESINYRFTQSQFAALYRKAETFKQFHEMLDKLIVKLGAVDLEGKPLTGIDRAALKSKLEYFIGKIKETNEELVKQKLPPVEVKTFPDMAVRPKVDWNDVFGAGQDAAMKELAELGIL